MTRRLTWSALRADERPSTEAIEVYIETWGHDFVQRGAMYIDQVEMLLCCPHAYAFLFLRGIFWRLASLLSPEDVDLLSRCRQGLSSSAAIYDLGYTEMLGHLGDDMTAREKDILLGWLKNDFQDTVRSWFPSPEILRRNGLDVGEWTQVEENLVLERYNGIVEGDPKVRPLTEEEWNLELQDRIARRLSTTSCLIPSDDDIEYLQGEMKDELRSWNSARLRDLKSLLAAQDPNWWHL